jgi:hypothetical protein
MGILLDFEFFGGFDAEHKVFDALRSDQYEKKNFTPCTNTYFDQKCLPIESKN